MALSLCRRWRRVFSVGVAVAAGFLLASGLGLALAETANPYKTVRATFNRQTGYPAGPEHEKAFQEFDERRKTQSLTWRPKLQPP